jgi:hypothetical protein
VPDEVSVAELICVEDDVVMVRWRRITLEGLTRVDEAMKVWGPKRGVYVGLINNDSAAPTEAVRKAMSTNLPQLAAKCTSINLILDGTGIGFAAMRSAAAAMFLVQGNRQMHMYPTLEAALRVLKPTQVDQILARAKAAGVL